MEVVGLMLVRNEADILRVNLLHHFAQGIDRFLVVDNGSTDGTDRVLEELAGDGRVRWTRDDGPYHQAEITTELAREAFRGGADWVVPIDADEFWYAPGGDLRRVLAESAAGALEVELINLIQRRDQLERSPAALLQMTRRTPQFLGPIDRAVELVEARQIAFVEAMYPTKWVSRPTATTQYIFGNHAVSGVAGSLGRTEGIICLHAPLRGHAVLQARMEDHGRRAQELERAGDVWWNARRWGRLIEDIGLEPALSAEWAANSYADDCLDVYGVRHPLVYDTRLRDLLAPWVEQGLTGHTGSARTIHVPPTPPVRGDYGGRTVGPIMARMRDIEGWLAEAEASLLMSTVALALAGREPHPVVEVGSYCGRSTVVLGSVVQAVCPGVKVYAIDPHEGQITSREEETRFEAPTFERFRHNIAAAGLTSTVEAIKKCSFEITWDKPISVLFIDGLHDYSNVSRDFLHFERWIVAGGYVIFDDYESTTFPGVVSFVNEVLDSGRYRKDRRVGRMIVIQKLLGMESFDDGGQPEPPDNLPAGSAEYSSTPLVDTRTTDSGHANPVVEAVRTIFEEGIGPLQAALDEVQSTVDGLQRTVAERTAWAERMVAEAEQRGAIIEELQRALAERTAWAERMAAEAEQRGAIIEELQRALAERGQ